MKRIAAISFLGIALAGAANAADIIVTTDITTSTTWTANNVYDLRAQIYVRNGATLTIEPGTVIASLTGAGGALIVTKEGQIFALGTKAKPIVFTSSSDRATWTGNDPKTGAWREASTEWGNVTIMGDAFISEHNVAGNVATCDPDNRGNMEGLTRGGAIDQYGGGNDEDDSGTFKYVSLRYGGLVIGPAVELNGLSLGGIGRETDIHHIDVMNNVDDGIEVWGGTVNLKYLNIWNIGDDSLDIDQGWRGKAQFGLIVQGYSTRSSQGSGTGDNCIEVDGAEDCHWQPVTTTTIYNLTVIGQPDSPGLGRVGGDHGTAWRSNARVQYRNCIFMDLGERLVAHDDVDGPPDNSCGYGANGTLSWADTWTTDYTVTSTVNACSDPAAIYQAQSSGKLAEIKDSVFFNNDNAAAYTIATAVGVTPGNGTNNNVVEPAGMPIKSITRGAAVTYLTFAMNPVISLDPRPANAAGTSVAVAPNDGFFTPARYRGAFGCDVWVRGWTACDAFGFLAPSTKADCQETVGNAGTRPL